MLYEKYYRLKTFILLIIIATFLIMFGILVNNFEHVEVVVRQHILGEIWLNSLTTNPPHKR